MGDEMIGRGRELNKLALAVGSGDDGLRLAMLSGPSGLGKTTLIGALLESVAPTGVRAVFIRGRAGSLSTPFAPLLEAIPELASLLSVTGGAANADTEHMGMALVTLVAKIVVDQPMLIVVDDAQALDESTIAVLPFLSGMSEHTNLSLLFVEQTDAIGIPSSYRSYVDGLLARRVVSHLELGPLSDDSIGEIVANVLAIEDREQVPAEIVERAQGNPWFAKELANGHLLGSTEIPTTIAAAATSRLHALDDVAQELVTSISVCPDGAQIGWLEQLSGQRPRHFVGTMESILSSGIVREDGDILTIAHPLMQQALIDELSSAMRRAIHLELVDVLGEGEGDNLVVRRARAYHLASAGRAHAAIEQYVAAAEHSTILGKPHEALADLLHAIEHEDRIAARVELLRQAATLSTQISAPNMLELWRELAQLAAATNDNEVYAYALHNLYLGSDGHRNDEPLRRAALLDPEHVGWSALCAAGVEFFDGNYAAAIERYEHCLTIARAKQDQLLIGTTLRLLATALGECGRTTEAIEVLRTAVTQLQNLRVHDQAIFAWGTLASNLLDDVQVGSAIEEANAIDRYVEDLGLETTRPYSLAMRAEALRNAGDFDTALTVVNEAVAFDAAYQLNPSYRIYDTAFVQVIRASIANECGTSNAGELAALALETIQPLNYESWELEARREVWRGQARRSGIDSVLGELVDLEAAPEPTFIANVALWLLRESVMTDASAGVERVRALRTAVEQWDGNRRVTMIRDEIDATLAAIDGGATTGLDDIAKAWSDAGCAADALRVNAVTGAIVLRAGNKDAAKTYLQTAKTGLAACGASADADLVAALLRQTGARSRASSRTTKVGPLTKRELEIARLVASGLKNSEVAGTLFLAEKTVAAHLSNIYGKVEVRSRVQLGQWIRENDPDFETTLASVG